MTHTKKRRVLAIIVDINEFVDQYCGDVDYTEYESVPYYLTTCHQPTTIKSLQEEFLTPDYYKIGLNAYESNFLESFIKYLKESYGIKGTDPIVIIDNH